MHVAFGYAMGSLTKDNISDLSREQRIAMQVVTILARHIPRADRNWTGLLAMLDSSIYLQSQNENEGRLKAYTFKNSLPPWPVR